MVTYNDELSIQPSSPADALAKLASYDKAWITYLFCLGSLALCILLGAGQALQRKKALSRKIAPENNPGGGS